MRAIAGALRRALPILFTARIISLATLPLLIGASVWIAIAVMAWDPLTGALAQWFGGAGEASTWRRVAAQIVAALMFAALAVATAPSPC